MKFILVHWFVYMCIKSKKNCSENNGDQILNLASRSLTQLSLLCAPNSTAAADRMTDKTVALTNYNLFEL